MNSSNLEDVVIRFREALRELVESGFCFNLSINQEFPAGACDDSSMLLAAYLADNGFPNALRISGVDGGRDKELLTHVWLSLDGTLIDITGSQFEEYRQPEILIAKSDGFLETFDLEPEQRLGDYRETLGLPRYYFNEAYQKVLERIATST